ncbi:hypothetical protein TSMEX_006726 [Taenia solium]
MLYCFRETGENPVLWGSRISGTPNGPSPSMYFRLPGGPVIKALLKNGNTAQINIAHGECYIGKEVWGRPCHINKDSANITLLDVLRQEALQIWGYGGLFSTVFFVPNCTFQKPEEGEWLELTKDV